MSQPIGPSHSARIANATRAQGASAASAVDALRTPHLSPAELSDARGQLANLRSDPVAASMRRIAEGVALTPGQISGLQEQVQRADKLPAVPGDVPGKRAWVQQHAPVVARAKAAALELGNEAFFMNPALKADADAASQAAKRASAQLVRVEEQAGLRRPEAPLDPARPLLQAGRSLASPENPAGPLRRLLAPAALLVDVADVVSRPLQAAAHPQAKQAFEARLAEYEKARRDFPLP